MTQSALRRKTSPALHPWSVDYLAAHTLQRALEPHCARLTGRVLDLGCGNRPYRAWLRAANEYIGFDLDRAASQPDVAGLASALPFPAASFDGVLCTQVLEHVPEPWRVCAEIARVLRPGGRLVLSAPQAWRLHEEPHDYYRFTRYGLTYLLEQAGLRVTALEAQGGVWRLIGQTFNNWLWERRHPAGSPAWWLSRVVSVGVGTPVNLAAVLLDGLWFDGADTLNYVVAAERPVDSA